MSDTLSGPSPTSPDPNTDSPSNDTPPDKTTRFLAFLIDGVLVAVVSAVLAPLSAALGSLLGGIYFLVRDGLELDFMNQRSLGKHVMNLKVERVDGAPMNIETSARRNWVFALGVVSALVGAIPLIGWLLALPVSLVGLALVLYEGYRVITRDDQQRWGDDFADTRVVRS